MKNNVRKIGVFTGNRAEYGMQYPILKAIEQDERLDYSLIVSGAHLKGDFGKTVSEIEADGFHIDHFVDIDLTGDDTYSTAVAIGSGTSNVAKAINEIDPDAMIVYADRFESFAAMIASTQMGIPTAHVEGGDYTEGGALDDSVRHAMTKLAHLHFTTNQQATDRVLGLGEEPWRVHTVGLPALDLIKMGEFTPEDVTYERHNLDPNRPVIIFTQHSVATEHEEAIAQVRPSLEALEKAAIQHNAQVIVTYPNDDAGGKRIMAEIRRFMEHNPTGFQAVASVGRANYHGILNIADICVGNSSSGIKETAAFRCPSINIGSRQQGRLRSDNIIDVTYNVDEISNAINTSLFDEKFKTQVANSINPYGQGNAGPSIANYLATVDLDQKLIQKKMTY
jgi:UDP-hydrolysing UDP-N-acetyl-D-glucosamine 2-epimerase